MPGRTVRRLPVRLRHLRHLRSRLHHLCHLRSRLRVVEVSGPSMVPTLRPGDRLLAHHGARIRPGVVVLARYRSMPDRLVVKRAVRRTATGWWLASDNPFAGGDSATHGVADVLARVVLKLGPGRPARVR